ncbi:hypothetical protein pEaSNUABM5_00242 [Erwinia phage pEa_SNUABM_5]|uniref:Uncharacterized protein n=1 Tax=Erwinia phage pEa_SNUABM_5 TaxID=2797313 RepID=A0A7T8EPM7_9CAUD|nr:hypothetical protein MPK73_gp242 [Erwinia phage pEa_SNUABM_5]QQO90384.1 hypothetical protein pEaSNUABM5_00242 [Erwinia phage pEa_SNUABM_5]
MRDFYPVICNRYRLILDAEPVCNPEQPTSLGHLVWMLDQIQTNTEQSLTKKHRWLGCVQGIMIAQGMITVNDERDATRNIFNGS